MESGTLNMMRPDEIVHGERRATETMSETSEGTVSTSVSGKSGFESPEALGDLAALLGISDSEDLHQERFRVHRRKLEQMLLGEYHYCATLLDIHLLKFLKNADKNI